MRKLVRDAIPDIIKAEGQNVPQGVLSKDEFRRALLEKLVEEAGEARSAQMAYLSTNNLGGLLAELADMQEVMDAIRAEFGISSADVNDTQVKKRARRGAFSRRIWCEFGQP